MPDHKHQFTQIEIYRITRVHTKYHGTAGDRAFLYRKCDCGKGEVFEYGGYSKMLALKDKLQGDK